MANAVAKLPFSASVQGQAIKVAATATPGTLVHTTLVSLTILDEIWLYLFNSAAADVVATVEVGGPAAPDQTLVLTVPTKAGLVLVVPGLILTGSGVAALTLKVFAASANVITAAGFVNRITP